jgi:hypothetical protein
MNLFRYTNYTRRSPKMKKTNQDKHQALKPKTQEKIRSRTSSMMQGKIRSVKPTKKLFRKI